MADDKKQDPKVEQTTQDAAQAVAQDPAPKPAPTVYSPTALPDGPGTPGKLVQAGALVQPNVEASLTDNLTGKTYPLGVWTEATPSAWLDGQVKANKMVVR